jgi:hypothetical protein
MIAARCEPGAILAPVSSDLVPVEPKMERGVAMEELQAILDKFAQSGWDLIAIPSKAYLNGNGTREDLIRATEQADKECGSCGCEFDPLYRRCIELKELL